jgi:hypothetical protein
VKTNLTLRAAKVSLLLLAILSDPVESGVYLGTTDCPANPVPPGTNFCSKGMTQDGTGEVNKFGVVHPMGYQGTGDPLTVVVCVDIADVFTGEEWVEPTRRAVTTWQALERRTGQCQDCRTIEEGGFPPEEEFHAETVILHELGHCAMGLGHPNLYWDPPGGNEDLQYTSHSMSYDGVQTGIFDTDGIPGNCEDIHRTILGDLAENVHWFRRFDNDPGIVDTRTIDTNEYSMRIPDNLPSVCPAAAEGTWAANGNHIVNAELGHPDTQSVMYSHLPRKMRYLGLSADDVNMVEMGMTGEDWIAGTSEDYTINLQFTTNCSGAHVVLSGAPLGEQEDLGGCSAKVNYSFPPSIPATARHYTVVDNDGPGNPVQIIVNTSHDWDFSPAGGGLIMSDDFESGDTSGWSVTVP